VPYDKDSKLEEVMMISSRIIVASLVIGSLQTFAADVAGKWTAQMPGPPGGTPGLVEVRFNFKLDGSTVTGSVETPQGEVSISEGKIYGDTISFAIKTESRGNSTVQKYEGKVSGDEIKFNVRREGSDQVRKITATKVSTT
jgi:hypothetical protein